MGLDNPLHIAVLVLVLVFVFRARRLPELGKALRAAVQGFTKSLGGEKAPRQIIVEQRPPSATTLENQTTAYILLPVSEPARAHSEHVPDDVRRLR
jgi:Sec-independent protein translocase protein TatA